MRGKASKIVLPGEETGLQLSLFPATGTGRKDDAPVFDPFPEVLRDEVGFGQVIATTLNGGGRALGLDFEFNPRNGKPSITGIASRKPLTCAVPWDLAQARHMVDFALENDIKLVGHNSVATEKVLLEKNLERQLPLTLFEDSMLEHYLLNQDFTKATEKEEEETSLGFMNLWVMASMTTDLPVWKSCRGRACDGPCPRHDVFSYCAQDAYASVEGHAVMQEEMKKWRVPYSFYRELIELSDICYRMEQRGLKVDLAYIDKLDAEMEEAKDKLFPFEQHGKTRVYKQFNPRSRPQVVSWFGKHGIHLKDTEKKYIQAILERQGVKQGHNDIKEYLSYLDEHHPTTSPLSELYDLYQFKSSGKGCSPWFGEKYRVRDYIHPRFIDTGTCTGRLASSRPNFTNIPTRGWGTAIKKAVIPRDENEDFLEVDASQLELRDVFYQAGLDPSVIGADAFTWMVEKGAGKFEEAVRYMPTFTARDISKSVSYGSLYGEGIKFITPQELSTARIKREIFDGCLRVYDDWEFRGKKVAFTGANLAERFFGSRTDANRKKALEIQEDLFFAAFPILRQWHKSVLASVEDQGYVRSPSGRFLRLYGEDVDDAKMAFSFLGQGVGADHIQAIMLTYWRDMRVIPDLMVHDSLLFSIGKDWDTKDCMDFLQPMFSETFRFPGLAIPGKPKRGPSYGELKPL